MNIKISESLIKNDEKLKKATELALSKSIDKNEIVYYSIKLEKHSSGCREGYLF